MMTVKERWQAALNIQEADRLAFWPKLDRAYLPARNGKFRGMPLKDLHNYIGSDRHEFIAPCVREERKNTSVTVETEGTERCITFSAPGGTLILHKHYDDASCSWHPMQFPVTDCKSMEIMRAMYEDVEVNLDKEALARNIREYEEAGNDAFLATVIDESPLMYFVEHLAGVANAHLLIADCPDEVNALFAAMHSNTVKRAQILAAHSPADALYMIENTSTTLISPSQYQQYCVKHITEYGNVVRDAGKTLILHMCGHLKALLPDLAGLPAKGFEAFTSPTLGNTTLADGRTACPDKCLIGGTNAMLWLKKPEEIIAQLEKDLAELPHTRGVVITSAGVMPPAAEPDTIRQVCDWVKQYRRAEG